jgi:hypothetical protein
MADYTKATNFTAKDTLPTGNSGKIVKGTEIDTELNAVANAIASKADINSPSFTGTPVAPTASAGSNTTQLATTAFVIAERTNTSTLTNKTLTSPTINTPTISTPAITGGTITGITDLAVADGGTGASTLAANNVLLGNGTSALQTVAPGTSGNLLKSNGTTWTSAAPTVVSGLGLNGEVWNNVSGSRAFNTTYTNSRSYPIVVSATSTCSTGSGITVYVNGLYVQFFQWQFNGCGAFSGAFIIVPPGATYQLNCSQGVQNWVELY